MSGRNKFHKYKRMINIYCLFFVCLPYGLRKFIWSFIDNYDGLLAVLTRYALLKKGAASVGDNVYVGPRVVLKGLENLYIGNNVSIHSGCYFDACGTLDIGENVSIAHNCSILTFEHSWDDTSVPIKYNNIVKKEVHIREDVWIGCGVRILSGVDISSRSIVAAGAVVAKDVPPCSIVGGIPAKVIKVL
jgi:acetyltransferase-like isoleucine patch superfamily enzyme